jgi:hypothetical protein
MKRIALPLVACLLIGVQLVAAKHLKAKDPLVYLAFDETQGHNVFADASGHDKSGDCRLSGASCPRSGQGGHKGHSVFFAASCPREYGAHVDDCDYAGRQKIEANLAPGQKTDCYFSKAKLAEKRGKYVTQAATCGSAVRFNPVTFTDGTVMMWYKEFAPGDGNPTQLFQPLALHTKEGTTATIARTDLKDFGWDLSLVGGNGVALGRIGPVHWGGYWCGKWHYARSGMGVGSNQAPAYKSGDSMRGWDHLAWHHIAFVFASGTTLVYIDGNMVAMMPNSGTCQKELSFLGKRNIRFDEQGGAVRGVEWSGGTGEREAQNSAGTLNNQLKVKEWSTNYFKGYMDEFKVYAYPMTAEEIKAASSA